jgi:hypothetical protein
MINFIGMTAENNKWALCNPATCKRLVNVEWIRCAFCTAIHQTKINQTDYLVNYGKKRLIHALLSFSQRLTVSKRP